MASVTEAAAAAQAAARTEFTRAFNENRSVLARFAQCESLRELHAVRDGFYLGLAERLCPGPHSRVMAAGGIGGDVAPWKEMVASVMAKARFVGSDLEGIWARLEKGRLEWIAAYRAAYDIKTNLRAALEAVGRHRGIKQFDLQYALMMWMYAMASVIPGACREAAVAWAGAVGMKDPRAPLKGFHPEKWNIEAPEWEPLDLALQAAAERGGTDLQAAWEAHPPEAAVQQAAAAKAASTADAVTAASTAVVTKSTADNIH